MCALWASSGFMDQLFLECAKAQWIWGRASELSGFNFEFPEGLRAAAWLNFNHSTFKRKTASIIAAILWFIWKHRCNAIFRGPPLIMGKLSSLQ